MSQEHDDSPPGVATATRPALTLVALATAGVLLTVLVGAAAAAGWDGQTWSAVLPRVAAVSAFFSVGIWAVARRPGYRFGWLLIGLGFLYALAMLNGSSNSILYSVGRTALPFAELALAYTLLAYPSGHLTSRHDRLLIGIFAVAVALLWPLAVLVGPEFDVGGPLVHCGDSCPANAFAAGASQSLARALSAAVYLAVFAASIGVVVSLLERYRRGRPILRRSLAPVAFPAAFRAASLAAYILAQAAVPGSVATAITGWLAVVVVIAYPLAFAGGILRARLFSITVLRALMVELNAAVGLVQFRMALGRALGDPDLRLVNVAPDGSLSDLAGDPMPRPGPGSSQALTPLPHGLAMVHDVALGDDAEFLDAVRAAVAVELEQESQRRRVRLLMGDVESSRSRLAVARDEERRRIERDLHDGAQQQLVAVRVQLGIVQASLERDPVAGAMLLSEVADDLDAAITQLRDLARGIYPPVLESEGVVEALRVAARSAVRPTTVAADDVERLPQEVERAAYFCCLEAMQNADRHAGTGARVRVRLLRAGDILEFSVSDDGGGVNDIGGTNGAGLVNIRDRVESAGGTLSIASEPGEGFKVTGRLPLAPAAP